MVFAYSQQVFSQTDEWKSFMKEKVKPRSRSYEDSILRRDDPLDESGKQKNSDGETRTKGVVDRSASTALGNVEKLLLEARVAMHKATRLAA